MKKQNGYTLIELVIVLVIIGIVTSAVVANIGATSSIRAEEVLTEVQASVANVRREALKGNSNTTFKLSSFSQQANGIRIASTPITDSREQCSCPDNLISLCLAEQTFCYDAGTDTKDLSFTFDQSSGRLSSNRAIFISSKTRNLALLINHEGSTQIAEFIGGQWRTQTNLQQPK